LSLQKRFQVGFPSLTGYNIRRIIMVLKFNPYKLVKTRLQRSIQTKLAIVLLLVGFIALSSLGILTIILSRQEVQNEVSKRNLEVAGLISGQFETQLKNIVLDLDLASHSFTEINPAAQPSLLFVFRLFKRGNPETYETLAWIDKDGIRRAYFTGRLDQLESPASKTAINITPLNMANDPAFITTRSGENYFSRIFFKQPAREPSMLIAVPIIDANRVFQGSLLVETNMLYATQIANNVRTDSTTNAALIDETGTIFASSAPNQVGKPIINLQLSRVLAGEKGSTEYVGADGEQYLAGYHPIKGRPSWGVVISQASSEAFAGITRLALIALAVVVIAIIIISIIAVWLSNTITRPLRELASAANRITTTGNLNEQIPIASQDEVGELSASFNGMILALRKTRLALEHWNRELEHKVEVRTKQLTRSNEKLEQINEQLERVNLHKSQFLANMSHELRTPLNAIIGFSEILQDQVFGELTEKQRRYVGNIVVSGRHLLDLVNDVLDLSKVEAGKMELHWEDFSVRLTVGEVVAQLGTLAFKKELSVTAMYEPDLDIISADRGRFRQVLYNLISNAIKFTPPGGQVQVNCRIEPGLEKGSQMALFEIKDTGIGISGENLESIFESFRQVDNTYSRQYQGTGLGLALTRKLVEMHGGKIWASSNPEGGSTFSFTVPLTQYKLLQSEEAARETPVVSN
jgi:signal transduction histidine kinase